MMKKTQNCLLDQPHFGIDVILAAVLAGKRGFIIGFIGCSFGQGILPSQGNVAAASAHAGSELRDARPSPGIIDSQPAG
jgi:hypothetical protein